MESSNKTKLTTSQPAARILADILAGHGVRDIVVSPGSRNAPLVVAVVRKGAFRIHNVVDERSAAFVALGMASRSGNPVALICTSGTALLNYAPAVAEAYYRTVPLIVVSADRPAAWIDQDDSQTIRQFEALENIVNLSVDIDSNYDTADFTWYTNRQINDAVIAATARRQGPVHINIRLDNPLGRLVEAPNNADEQRIIRALRPEATIKNDDIIDLAETLTNKRVLIIAGFGAPDRRIVSALRKVENTRHVVVMHEAQSNINGLENAIDRIDATLAVMSDDELTEMAPDVVITFGGSLVSRMVKKWLRHVPGLEHIHIGIGPRDRSVDVFCRLVTRIEVDPAVFLSKFAAALAVRDCDTNFKARWMAVRDRSRTVLDRFVNHSSWCDLWATQRFISSIPRRLDLQVSNGTSVRYLQMADYAGIHRIDCNRGVSGIDGSTSTAIGAAVVSSTRTVLLTGDTSAKYDIGALGIDFIPGNFVIAVLNNGGGDIFRFIGATSALDECETHLAMPSSLPLEQLAKAYDFEYVRIASKAELDRAVKRIWRSDSRLLVDIDTRGADNAEILRNFFGNTNHLTR